MRVIVISRAMAAGLTVLLAVSIAACSANLAPSNAGPDNDQAVTPAASTTPSAAASPTAAAPSATPATPGGVQNLVITSAEISELTAGFAAREGMSVSSVLGGGPLPGSVYYAYDPATGTYWALANFELIGGMTVPVPMMFQKAGTGPWQYQRADLSQNGTQLDPTCSELQWFPAAVLMAWSMPTAPPAGVTC